MPAESQAVLLPPDVPRQLWPDDLDAVRLDDHPRVNSDLAHQVLLRSPGSSFWIPATSEFILVTPWRHRKELSTIHTLGAFAGEDVLMRATMEHARTSGKAGFVVVDINEVRHPAFYARFGLEPFEEIVTYEWRESRMLRSIRVDDRLEFIRLETGNTRLMRQVIALDHAAFPWFWWNSDWEFAVYLDQPGVEIWVGIRDDGRRLVCWCHAVPSLGSPRPDRDRSPPAWTRDGSDDAGICATAVGRPGWQACSAKYPGSQPSLALALRGDGFRTHPAG